MNGRRVGARVTWVLSALAQVVMLWAALRVVVGPDDEQWSELLVWDVVVLLYLTGSVISISYRTNHARVPAASAPEDRGRWSRLAGFYWGVLPALFSLLGLSAALDVLFIGHVPDPVSGSGAFTRGLAAVAIVTAWLMMHLSYARRYQFIVTRDGEGLEFPGRQAVPTPVEYLYFAITVGASFATSDASVTSTRMRWTVLVHSVVSFFYNAVVLAVGFRILTGG